MKKNNFKSLMQAAVLICTPLVIASCDDVFGDVDNPVSSHISIKDAAVNLVLHADSAAKATYTRTAIAASGAQIEYSSTKPEIATVDAKTGKITAVNGGECEIIAKATGLDSRGNKTYQEEEVRFPVKVTDYRCRVKFEEAAATVNSADIEDGIFKLMSSEVYPKGCPVTISHVAKVAADGDPVSSINKTTGAITLAKKDGVSVITVTIDDQNASFDKNYEVKSNAVEIDDPKNPGKKIKVVQATFTLTVKEGVAYFSGYDDKGGIRTTMFKATETDAGYKNLSDVLKGKTADVALEAGWYCLDKTDGFANNIRVKGDVNIILKNKADLTAVKAIMDESAKQSYKLNFYPDVNYAASTVTPSQIQDFKEVNVLGVKLVNVPVNKVENVTINKGTLGALSGTGVLTMTDANAGAVTGFETVTISKGTVGNLSKIGTATITDITTNSLTDIKTLTLNKVKAAANISDVTTLNINKECEIGTAKAPRNLNYIETVNMADGKVYSDNVIANALNVSGGDLVANDQIYGFDAKKNQAAGKVTMSGGTLTVGKSLTATNVKAVIADVEVTKGDFTAESNYHAVEGALIGTFYGSTDKNTWTKIENEDRPKYITTIEPKKP